MDLHQDYLSTQLGTGYAEAGHLNLIEVQHHHAHLASVMAESGMSPDCSPVLGLILDGLGLGADGSLWGGEFLKADFRDFERLASFQPVPLPGGVKAMHEPWRNTWSHLEQVFGWDRVVQDYGDVDIVQYLQKQPLDTLKAMVERGINSPWSSSCGRFFDAVAAALGICRERQHYEAQAAIELESMAATAFDTEKLNGYRLDELASGPVLNWQNFWRQILADLRSGVEPARIAARFHHGLADILSEKLISLCRQQDLSTAVLGGGVFQNKLLLEGVLDRVRPSGITLHAPLLLPANDGGIALGQAAVAAARMMHPGS